MGIADQGSKQEFTTKTRRARRKRLVTFVPSWVKPMPQTIWTIGHSKHSIERFFELLAGQSIGLVADVRRFPASRAHPHFNLERLAASLAAAGIGYRHFPELGGRRSKRLPDSPNTAWRVEAFNAYADHLQSAEAQEALQELMRQAAEAPTAFMCAEALPWQCHRRIIADHLLAAGWTVFDIMPAGQATPHKLPDFARLADGVATYPGGTLFQ
jgi:uncharacterized protein (DUF488 family)